MEIKYKFDEVRCEFQGTASPTDDCPYYYTEICDNVEHIFKIEPSVDDIVDFFIGKNFSKEKIEGIRYTIEYLFKEEMLYEFIDSDEFYEFMEWKYEEEAREECERVNGPQ